MSQKIIKSIRKLKQKGLYLIQIDDNEYKVSEDLIVEMTLIKGRILSDEEYQTFLKKAKQDNLLLKTYDYISYQMRSEREVIEYLQKNNASDEEINNIVYELKKCTLIDDNALAETILYSLIQSFKGPKYFKKKLYDRKIRLNIEYPEDEEIIALEESIAKNKDKYSEYPLAKQKSLLTQKLLRDGFTESKVFSAINHTIFTDNSSKSLEKDLRKVQDKYSAKKYDNLSKQEKRVKIIKDLIGKGYSYTDITKNL